MDDSVRNLIRTSGNVDQIRDTARSNGMRLMQEDALGKVLSGMTTLEEVLRVVPTENFSLLECAKCNERILPLFKYCPHCGTKNAAPSKVARSRPGHWFPEEVSHQ